MRATGMHKKAGRGRRVLAVLGGVATVALVGVGGVMAASGGGSEPGSGDADSAAPRAVDSTQVVAAAEVQNLKFVLAPPSGTGTPGTGSDRLCLQAELPGGFTSVGCGEREVLLRDGAFVRFMSEGHAVLAGYVPGGANRVMVGASSSTVTADGFFVVRMPADGEEAVFEGPAGTRVVPLAPSRVAPSAP